MFMDDEPTTDDDAAVTPATPAEPTEEESAE
jgi:hypothetical protein